VAEKNPEMETRAAAAEQIVASEDGDGRNGRQNIAGELRFREREEDDGNESPENQEFRKGVAGPLRGGFVGLGVAMPPFSYRSLDAVD
jgi:hypothetical protein